MTAVQTTTPINWGGANPLIDNKIRVSISELSRNENGITYAIKDTPIVERSFIDESGNLQTYETDYHTIRQTTVTITSNEHDTLYINAENYIDAHFPNLTIFEKEKLRSKVALLLYIQNDKLDNGKCIYNTEPEQWELY